MTDGVRPGARILGSLRAEGGRGVVRIEDRLDTGIDDAWSALTDPARLARWYGEVEGDLRPGGAYRAKLFASGWEGTGRIEECEPPRRFVVASRDPDEPEAKTTQVTLTDDGDQTVLVIEQHGLPRDLTAAYGAGMQVHAEDLAAHLAGHGRCDAVVRWGELHPGYQELAVGLE
jgi:uncharacterized protein YndB with AHSA1/START domain